VHAASAVSVGARATSARTRVTPGGRQPAGRCNAGYFFVRSASYFLRALR
jgi:hypothetical protein